MAFTFGSTPATTTSAAPLFGSSSTATTSAAPLFGATTTAATTSAPSLFGSTSTTSAPAPLFGSTATTNSSAGTLFGATATTSTPAAGGGLFGGTPAKTTAAPSLFGATNTATTTAASGGLFGSTATSTASTGLFGATTATATPATTTAAPVGLGGSASAVSSLSSGGAGTTLGAPTVEKENVREGEVPKPIMELLQQVKIKIKENKGNADQFMANSTDNAVRIKDKLHELNQLINEGVSASAQGDEASASLCARVQRDLRLGKEAQAVQDIVAKNPHAFTQHTVHHMIELIREYDGMVNHYQEVVEQLTVRIRDILQGKSQMTTNDLKEYLTRFDAIFSSVANKLYEANSQVQELRSALAADGQIQLREAVAEQPQSWWQNRGIAAFPSHSTLLQIGSMLKPAQAAGLPGATTTGTGLFGSTGTTGGSLFGSTTAAKPSLFGSTTGSTGSLFPSLTATSTAQPTTSLFPPPAAKTTSFGSTLSTNTTGLLFSSKK